MEALTAGWALVTGAGRGIGRDFCRELVRRRFHLVAVARTRSDLDALGEEVRAAGLQFKAVVKDLSEPGADDALIAELGEVVPLLTLVCLNASHTALGPFHEIPLETQRAIVQLNVTFPLGLVFRLLPHLKRQPESWVFMTTSQGAYQPVPWMANYAAAKTYLHSLSLALAEELRDTPVRVVTVVPAHTHTSSMAALRFPEHLVKEFGPGLPSAGIAAKMAQQLDRHRSGLVTTVRALGLQRFGMAALPLSWVARLAGSMFKAFRTTAYFAGKAP